MRRGWGWGSLFLSFLLHVELQLWAQSCFHLIHFCQKTLVLIKDQNLALHSGERCTVRRTVENLCRSTEMNEHSSLSTLHFLPLPFTFWIISKTCYSRFGAIYLPTSPKKKIMSFMFLASWKWLVRGVGKMSQEADDVLGHIKFRTKLRIQQRSPSLSR